jgi:hypothetical protein
MNNSLGGVRWLFLIIRRDYVAVKAMRKLLIDR